MDNEILNKAYASVEYIVSQFKTELPSISIILGSGLSGFTNVVDVIQSINYADIPFFPEKVVEGQKGLLTLARISPNQNILILEGRFHLYEGYTPKQVIFPIIILHLLGVKSLILSNAAGGINHRFNVGDLMIINDHINLTGNHPLIGKNDSNIGPRFLDQTTPYHLPFIEKARQIAQKFSINLQEGVYVGLSGPTYETKAEIKAFRILGGDAVGMSTIYEVIVANYFGMNVLAISTITNMATGLAESKHDHKEVVKVADNLTSTFSKWVKQIICEI